MDKKLTEELSVLESLANEIQSVAIRNEERVVSVQMLYKNAEEMKEEIAKLDEITESTKTLSDDLHLLSLNTSIESDRYNTPTVNVIANKMTEMSKGYKELGKNAHVLAMEINRRLDKLMKALDNAVNDAETNSASLEELSAGTEELLASVTKIDRSK